jgi:hypothetical protein
MADDISQTPVEDKQPVSPTNQNQGGELTPEELEFNKLSGSAQERFKKILLKNKELAMQNEELASRIQSVQQPIAPPVTAPEPVAEPNNLTADQEQAIENLRKFGVWTKKDQQELEKKQKEDMETQQRELQDNILIETEYSRLETVHNGSDGLPRFDRDAIEEYMRETGVYNPEKAYDDLYRDEIFDKWAKGQSGNESPVYSERPSVSVGSSTEPLSMEGLRERLRQPDGKEWWEKNRDRLLPVIGELFR